MIITRTYYKSVYKRSEFKTTPYYMEISDYNVDTVVKQSRVRSTMRWWTKCISMVVAKTASRNIAFKTDVMSQAVLEAQASFVTRSDGSGGFVRAKLA